MAVATESVRIRVARFARRTLGLGAYAAGTVVGSRYARLLGLRSASELALVNGKLDRAERLAEELLELAVEYSDDWYYGNALHNGHVVLGLVQMQRGNLQGAEHELLRAGESPGSPQLNSFGPSLVLARDLLMEGRVDAVLEYLELCRVFWYPDSRSESSAANAVRVGGWTEEIRRGEVPDFGPNLIY
ncbi:MAG: hypothetical protein IH968_10760 [Gemmatimonadetes bacterium]|nr:hypothetical protein [Gemmatimonadota bacterium]